MNIAGTSRKGFKRTPTTVLEVRLNKVTKEIIGKFLESIMALKVLLCGCKCRFVRVFSNL